MKPVSPEAPTYVQKLGNVASKIVMAAVVETLDPETFPRSAPEYDTRLLDTEQDYLGHIKPFLVENNLTPYSLCETFIAAIKDDPGTLEDMARRLSRGVSVVKAKRIKRKAEDGES